MPSRSGWAVWVQSCFTPMTPFSTPASALASAAWRQPRRYVLPGRPARVPHDPEAYFSLFPLEGAAGGVCITGAKYPLQNARLVPDATLGASNETRPGGAEVQVADGSLLLVCAPK